MSAPSPVQSESKSTDTVQSSQSSSLTQREQQVQSLAEQTLCDRNGCNLPAIKKCARCERVYYCNEDCQQAAWKTHHAKICISPAESEKYATKDRVGLTPLHYAVLFGREHKLPLAQQAQLQSVKDSFNGTPADLKQAMAPAIEGVIPLHMASVDGKSAPLTQAEFVQRTGVQFKEGVMATAEALLQAHTKPPKDYGGKAINPSDAKVKQFESAPPTVFLAEEFGMGLGLRAGQNIGEGDIICPFGGELVVERRDTMPTLADAAIQDRFSGPAFFANDGPPNCGIHVIENYKGIPLDPVLIAIRPIKQGEYLHLDYGRDHPIKKDKYAISQLAFQEVAKFCRNGLFYSIQVPCPTYQLSQIFYICNTFPVFISLHLQEILDVTKTKPLLEGFFPGFFELNGSLPPTYFELYGEALDAVVHILKLKKKEGTIVSKLEELAKKLTANAFLQVLLNIGEDQAFSSSSIPSYQALGELFEHLYTVTHGKLSDKRKTVDIQLDLPFINERFASLPAHLKSAFKEQVSDYASVLEEKKLHVKKKAFVNLLHLLN